MESIKSRVQNEPRKITIELNFLSESKARWLIKMFDSKEAYCKNYPPLKAICSGLHRLILDNQPNVDPKIGKMFKAINELQGILILDDISEWNDIMYHHGIRN